MNIKYDLSIDDVVAYTLYFINHNPKLSRKRKIQQVLLIIFAVAFLAGAIVGYGAGSLFLMLWCSFGFLFVIYMYVFYLTMPMVTKRAKKELLKVYIPGKNSVVGIHQMSVMPECILDVTEMDEEKMRWDMIESVATTDAHLFLIIHAGRQALIIPRRAFENDGSFAEFVEVARKYKQAAEAKV